MKLIEVTSLKFWPKHFLIQIQMIIHELQAGEFATRGCRWAAEAGLWFIFLSFSSYWVIFASTLQSTNVRPCKSFHDCKILHLQVNIMQKLFGPEKVPSTSAGRLNISPNIKLHLCHFQETMILIRKGMWSKLAINLLQAITRKQKTTENPLFS